MRIKLKNVRPLAKRGKRAGDEDDLLAYLMNSNNTVYSPTGGYNVQFAPTAENRDYQAVGLPAAQIVGQSPNPQARYVNQLANQVSQQQGVGNNNDYFRTVGILNNIMKDKKYVGKDGALNQQGWAKLAQDQMFGPGSDWYKRHSQSAKDVASGLAQVATLPYFAGMGGLELLGSVGGGALGATIGTNIGQNFDNPYTGNYAGSELGGLFGGLAGGATGANIRGLGRAYIRGMDNLANRQDLYWASRGYKLNGTQPTAADISTVYPIESRGNNLVIKPTGRNINPRVTTKAEIRYMPGVKRAKANAIRERYQQQINDDILAQEELDWQQAYKDYNPTEDDIKFYNTLKMLSEKEPTPFLQNNPEYNTYYETMQLTPQIKENMLRDAKQYGRTYVDNRYLYKYGGTSKGPIGKKLNTLLNKAKQTYTDYVLNNVPASEQVINYLEQLPKMPIDRFDNVRNQIARRYYEPIRDDQKSTPTIGLRLANVGYDVPSKYNAALDNITYKLRSKKEFGGRVKRPFGGGIPEGVPFVEAPVAYSPQYNGLWAPTAPIRNASPIDIMGGRPVVRGPIAGNVISSLGTPVDELELNSWRTNAVGNPNTYALSTEQRPIKRAVNLNSRNNTRLNTSRTEQSWLNRKTPNKPLKISTARYNAGRALSTVSKAIPYYYGIELATAYGEPHYDAEGYLIDNITGERLESEPRHTPRVGKRLAKLQTQVNNAVSKYNQLQYSNNNNVDRINTNTDTVTRANTNAKPEQASTTAQQTAKQPVNRSTSQTNTKQSDIQTKTVVSDKASIPKNADYTVVKGDSPWKIADKAGITINTLYELNPGMEKRGVYVGDSVNLTRNITSDQGIYKAKRGDSPWRIAHNNGMTLDEFYKLNPNAKSRGVYIGDEFIVNKNRSQKKYGGAVRRRLESGGQLSY